MDLTTLSPKLAQHADGVWRPHVATEKNLSFPEHGHDECFEIEDTSFWFAHRNDLLASALKRFPMDGAFLDIGGGNGVVSARLAAEGIETVLIEPAEQGAHNAHKRGLTNVICATLEEAGFTPQSFGGAGLFDVIEHIEDDAAILSSAHRVLRPGGVLAVTVPAFEWLWSAQDDRAGHFRRYDSAQLRRVLEATGFDVQYTTYCFAALTAPVFILRSVRHRLLGRGTEDQDLARSAAREHEAGGLQRKAVELLLAPEVGAVRAGRSIPFGLSILAVAKARH